MARRNPRGRRRRGLRALISTTVALALIAGLGVAALYGWHQLTRHPLTADSCQVVGQPAATIYAMDPDQLLNASIIADVAMRRALPERAVIVALATAQQESKLRNLDYGDADSLGLFQQRPSEGWGSASQITQPIYAAGKFFDALVKVTDWQTLSVGDAAQAVQRSAFPQAYASWAPRATALAAALTGTTTNQLTCRLVHPGISVATSSSPAVSSAPGVVTASAAPTSIAAAVKTTTSGLRNDLAITSPSVANIDSKMTTITVSGLGSTGSGDDAATARQETTVAAWAVAHASADGIASVVLGNQEWRPDKDGWRSTKTVAPAGHVVIAIGRD